MHRQYNHSLLSDNGTNKAWRSIWLHAKACGDVATMTPNNLSCKSSQVTLLHPRSQHMFSLAAP